MGNRSVTPVPPCPSSSVSKDTKGIPIVWEACLLQDEVQGLHLAVDKNDHVYIFTNHGLFLMERILFVELLSDHILYIGTRHSLSKRNARHVLYRTASGAILYEFPQTDVQRFIRSGDVALHWTNHLFMETTGCRIQGTTRVGAPWHPFVVSIHAFLSDSCETSDCCQGFICNNGMCELNELTNQ